MLPARRGSLDHLNHSRRNPNKIHLKKQYDCLFTDGNWYPVMVDDISNSRVQFVHPERPKKKIEIPINELNTLYLAKLGEFSVKNDDHVSKKKKIGKDRREKTYEKDFLFKPYKTTGARRAAGLRGGDSASLNGTSPYHPQHQNQCIGPSEIYDDKTLRSLWDSAEFSPIFELKDVDDEIDYTKDVNDQRKRKQKQEQELELELKRCGEEKEGHGHNILDHASEECKSAEGNDRWLLDIF